MLFTFKIGKLTSFDFASEEDLKEVFGPEAELVSIDLEVPSKIDDGIHLTIVVKNPSIAKIREAANTMIESFKDQGLY